jgi:hypothetical protein
VVRTVIEMFVILKEKRDILDLTAEQLRHLPKEILLQEFGNYVEYIWDKLPEDLRNDVEVQEYRVCLEHYNQPWQRTHIDGPPPTIKNCGECQSRRKTT